ncbi:MAG: TIGR04086 family membrane protein [Bacillota bacterium]
MGIVKINSIIKGLLWALVISLVLSIIITLLLYFSPMSEALLPSFATLIFFLSILLGSTISAKSAGSKGLIHGLGVGVIYLIFSVAFGIFLSSDPFSWLLFGKKIAYTTVGSALGGIIGIGLSQH